MTFNISVYLRDRYANRMALAKESLGSCCAVCGSKEFLELDHIDPNDKLHNISDLTRHSDSVFWIEVKKCQLLCRDCHLIKTVKEQESAHGTFGKYDKGCRCMMCKEFRNAYARSWKAKHKALSSNG